MAVDSVLVCTANNSIPALVDTNSTVVFIMHDRDHRSTFQKRLKYNVGLLLG